MPQKSNPKSSHPNKGEPAPRRKDSRKQGGEATHGAMRGGARGGARRAVARLAAVAERAVRIRAAMPVDHHSATTPEQRLARGDLIKCLLVVGPFAGDTLVQDALRHATPLCHFGEPAALQQVINARACDRLAELADRDILTRLINDATHAIELMGGLRGQRPSSVRTMDDFDLDTLGIALLDLGQVGPHTYNRATGGAA